MLATKNLLKILQRTKCISKLSDNHVITGKFPRHFHALIKYEPRTNLYGNDYRTIQICRNYAKGKDKKKEKGKSKIVVNETMLGEVINIDTIKNQMEKAIDQLKEDFIKHTSLRSTTGSLEMLPINVDGNDHTLQEVAQIVRKNPKTIVINMTVFPQFIPTVLKTIEKSGMNLNPQQDGTTLFIPIPKVTKEHRELLAKAAKTHFLKCKDAIRNVQLSTAKKFKKKDGLSEDLVRNVENQLQAIADGYIVQADKILESKQAELLGKE